jgi:hypothetical protein
MIKKSAKQLLQRLLLFCLLYLSVISTNSLTINLPRISYQEKLSVQLKGSSTITSIDHEPINVIFVAEEGHTIRETRSNICKQVNLQFELASNGIQECTTNVSDSVRLARGLAMQHSIQYSNAINTLESGLIDSGIHSFDFPKYSIYHRPNLASFFKLRIQELTKSLSTSLNVCLVGFEAGHSSLFFLVETIDFVPSSIVYSFEINTTPYTVFAHDLIDAVFPGRLRLLLGDSLDVISQLPHYYPEARCNILILGEESTYNDTLAQIELFSTLVAENHILVLSSKNRESLALNAWKDAETRGHLDWEGTIYSSQSKIDEHFVVGTIFPTL